MPRTKKNLCYRLHTTRGQAQSNEEVLMPKCYKMCWKLGCFWSCRTHCSLWYTLSWITVCHNIPVIAGVEDNMRWGSFSSSWKTKHFLLLKLTFFLKLHHVVGKRRAVLNSNSCLFWFQKVDKRQGGWLRQGKSVAWVHSSSLCSTQFTMYKQKVDKIKRTKAISLYSSL